MSAHLEQSEQQEHADGDGHDAADGPRRPVHRVAEPHHPHHLAQASLLLEDDALHDHRHRVDPGEHEEERHAARDRLRETVHATTPRMHASGPGSSCISQFTRYFWVFYSYRLEYPVEVAITKISKKSPYHFLT